MFQQAFTNFNFSFDMPNGRNAFTSGDQVKGHIRFDLTKETKITSITMTLNGMVHVHWSSSSGSGKRRRRRHYSAKVVFFDYKGVIMQENTASSVTEKLQPGTHLYPFTCNIPQGDFPNSFHGVHGKISYTLTVGIKRPWHLTKDFKTELNYRNYIDVSRPELWAPLSGTNIKTLGCLCCTSGFITMKATVDKKAFNPGEMVKITCRINNGSSRTVTPKMKLQQKQGYRLHDGIERRKHVKNLASLSADAVTPHTSDVYIETMLQIPPSTPLTVSNCSLLEVSYTIEVSLSIRASWDLVVLFPIILCDSPVHSLDPPSL